MIQTDLPYNPKRDLKPVNPEGWLDLKAAYVNGIVPGNIEINEESFNNIEDPSKIGNVPRDPFQAMRAASAAQNAAKAAKADTPSGGEQ